MAGEGGRDGGRVVGQGAFDGGDSKEILESIHGESRKFVCIGFTMGGRVY